jgi:nicotinate phosphoribosyltransferase
MIIQDILDNDLYKFTTMNAVQRLFPWAEVVYKFVNRGNTSFPEGFSTELRREVDAMAGLQLTKAGEDFIRRKCYYFDPVFIDLLKGYRYNPDEISIKQVGGKLEVEVSGLWYRTVLWEVPLLAIISELYFKLANIKPDDFVPRAVQKAMKFKEIGAELSEFVTRRRFSFDVQDKIIDVFKENMGRYFNGTSNVYFAMKYNVIPIGTHPHEWFMYHAAQFGYRMASTMALENWVNVYQGKLGIALTDTFTTDSFFKSFSTKYAKLFDGIRWDSGDPLSFTDKAIEHYHECAIDPSTKTIVYSDALDFEKVKQIKEYVNGRVHDVYGIGTYLTNDVGDSPLNIVIKLASAKPQGYSAFVPTVKLSDSKEKYTGDQDEIQLCLKMIGRL